MRCSDPFCGAATRVVDDTAPTELQKANNMKSDTTDEVFELMDLMFEKPAHEVLNKLQPLATQIQRERDFWMEDAARHLRNECFYRDLIVKIGEPFGVAAYTSDDGSVQQDVLALRVPELVDKLRAQLSSRDATIAGLERERDEAIANHGKKSGFWGRAASRLVTERDALRDELTRVRPKHDCYDRICAALGIEKDILGFVNALRQRVGELQRVVNDILHQRTGPIGMKVEDDLMRENEPLYLRALASTQPHTT